MVQYRENIFEVGDIVKLNSNDDIIMTIHNTYDNIIICRWFDKNYILQSAKFNQLELNIVQKISKLNQKEENEQEDDNSLNKILESTKDNIIPEIDIDEDEIPF